MEWTTVQLSLLLTSGLAVIISFGLTVYLHTPKGDSKLKDKGDDNEASYLTKQKTNGYCHYAPESEKEISGAR